MLQYVKKYWWVALAGLFVVPYFAWQNMKERKAQEAEEHGEVEHVSGLDDRVGVSLVTRGPRSFLRYLNNQEQPTDGIGIAVLTWDDQQANPDRLKKAGYQPDQNDFPVVVFFNQSGFDATGDPAVVRRAKDGSVAFEVKDKPRGRLRQALARPDGTWSGFFYDSPDPLAISGDDFYRLYLGVEPPQPAHQLSQEELDKMSPEQLEKLGIKKIPREEAIKQAKTGIRGSVIKVGGRETAVQPLAGVKVYALKGKVEPLEKLDPGDQRLTGVDKTDKDGKFTLPLPSGVYTLVVEQDGKLYGNSYRGEKWPSVTVKDGWVDYEFRRGN